MPSEVNEFIAEQKRGLKALLRSLRESRIEATRKAARDSAVRIKSLNARVHSLARSGLRLNAASQGAIQDLLQLQEEIVTSALTDAAAQIERLAYTESLRDFTRAQGEVLQAARQRIVDDIGRAVRGLRSAAGDVRRSVAPAEKPVARTTPSTRPKRKQVKRRSRAAAKTATRRAPRKATPKAARKATRRPAKSRR